MTRPHRLLLPPLKERLAAGRPVLTRDQALDFAKRVAAMSTAEDVMVEMSHTVKSVTQLASNEVRSVDDGEVLRISIRNEFGDGGFCYFLGNQLDDAALRALVERADAVGKGMPGSNSHLQAQQWDVQDTYAPAQLWHDTTVDALHSAREAIIPAAVETVRKAGFNASGFMGVMARAEAVVSRKEIVAFSDETDSEVSITARPLDNKSSGWAGTAVRDWKGIDAVKIATEASEIAAKNRNPQALEPGRRTAILSPAAVVQLMRFLSLHFDGGSSDQGKTGFSKVRDQEKGSKFNQRLFDTRTKITTDPADPEGGFRPWFWRGYASHPTTWVEGGELKFLGYGVGAISHGKPYAEMPYGFRLHGGDTTLDQMIAQCDEGIYVNRLSSVDSLDWHTGMVTGATRDGCFLIRHGKIDRPVKNFRFQTSPFFFLNNIIAMGPTKRAAYGYAPWTQRERDMSQMWWPPDFFDWPRRPMIVPPLMVCDFNFNALVDAV